MRRGGVGRGEKEEEEEEKEEDTWRDLTPSWVSQARSCWPDMREETSTRVCRFWKVPSCRVRVRPLQ